MDHAPPAGPSTSGAAEQQLHVASSPALLPGTRGCAQHGNAPLPTLPTEILTLIFLESMPALPSSAKLWKQRSSFVRVVALLSSTWTAWARQELMRNVVLPNRKAAELWLDSQERESSGDAIARRRERTSTKVRNLRFGSYGVKTNLTHWDMARVLKACYEVEEVGFLGVFPNQPRIGTLLWGANLHTLELHGGEIEAAVNFRALGANTLPTFSHIVHLNLAFISILDTPSQPFLSPATFPALCSLILKDFVVLKRSPSWLWAAPDLLAPIAPQLRTLQLGGKRPVESCFEIPPLLTSLQALSFDLEDFGDAADKVAFFSHLPPSPLRHLRLTGQGDEIMDAMDLDVPELATLESITLPKAVKEGEASAKWERMREACARRGIEIRLEDGDYEGVEWWRRMRSL